MITPDHLIANKDRIDEAADQLSAEDIAFLVSLLTEKNDELRYQALLVLQKRSELSGDVYPHRETFAAKIVSDNSYQRNIGISLIAANMKWDEDDFFAGIADNYLACCEDEKPITSRLAIQSIGKWIAGKPKYYELVKNTLLDLDIESQRETMKKLILSDIISVLTELQKIRHSDDITTYFIKAMTSGRLDNKSVKQLEQYL